MALYSQTINRVRVYGQFSKPFKTSSGVRQGCPASPFLFNFVVDEIMGAAFKGLHNIGVEIAPGEKICDLECADDIICLFETSDSAQTILDRPEIVDGSYGMAFAPAKCKVLLQD